MNEIIQFKQFEDTNVKVLRDNNNDLWFEIYSTGMALGHVKKNAIGCCYPRKERIEENLKNAEIQPCVRNGHSWINESQLYDFMLEARTDKCRVFRKWVVNEVLPSLRKTGTYTVSNYKPYAYINKTFHGRPVLTTADIVNIYGLKNTTLYNHLRNQLVEDRDYKLIQGNELTEYNNENPSLPHCRKSVFVVFNTGLSRIVSFYNLDKTKIPLFMTEHKGYVVSCGVRQLMEYVRREIKGVEALTYLIESDESPCNLENYRKTLVDKLSSINWWKADVSHIKLGIQQITVPQLQSIHKGEYGIK